MGLCGSAESDRAQESANNGVLPEDVRVKVPPAGSGTSNGPPPSSSSSSPPPSSHVQSVASNLALIPLLSKLSQPDLELLAKAMKTRHYKHGEDLLKEGDEGSEFFILHSGTAAVLKWNPQKQQNEVIAELKPRDYAGETALLNNSKRGATIRASSPEGTQVYTLDRQAFQALFGAHKKLNITFAKRQAVSAEAGGGGGGAIASTTSHSGGSTSSMTAGSSRSSVSATSTPPNARHPQTEEEVRRIHKAIGENILFANLTQQQKQSIISGMWYRSISPGEEIIKQGDLGDFFYCVHSGLFEIYVKDARSGVERKVATRGPDTSMGELALMYNAPRAATVRAVEESAVWCVDRATFRRVVTQASTQKLREYEDFLRGVQSFSVLLENERSRVAEALEEVVFPAGHRIVKQGEHGETLFIVKQGEVVVTQHKDGSTEEIELTRYHPGNCFGERSIIKSEPRAATCTAVTDVTCLYLGKENVNLLLGSLESIFQERIEGYGGVGVSNKQNASTVPASGSSPGQHQQQQNGSSGKAAAGAHATAAASSPAAAAVAATHDVNITLQDLTILGTLGKGSFGHVQLVRHNTSGRIYALKIVSKQSVVQSGQQEHILSEKNVMLQLNHTFLIRLYQTFQSRDALYFVLEPSLGGELFSLLRTKVHFDEATAKFYAAGVILAFEFMHESGIIYRDLKPENLLLDAQGYIKITDFGFAKKIGSNGRTWTLCGTPDYLAPEVVSGSSHGKGVDWWCLGVLIYEMLASYPPFYDEEPMKTYQKIIQAQPAWPLHFSRGVIDLLKGLLCAKPTKRLGVIAGGASVIKKHPWFYGFDWSAFEQRRMKPPFLIPVKNETDLSNFEEYPDEDMQIPKYLGDTKHKNWDKDF